jgi:hypothetical protein
MTNCPELMLGETVLNLPELDPDLETDPEQDPLVRDMDPQIRIRTRMSRIPNTVHNTGVMVLPTFPID